MVDLSEWQMSYVNELLRRLDVQLHLIDQRRPAGNKTNVRALLRRLRFGRGRNRLLVVVGARELESFHAGFSLSCRTL